MSMKMGGREGLGSLSSSLSLAILICFKLCNIAESVDMEHGYLGTPGLHGSQGDGRPPGWKWWRFRDAAEKEILDHLLHRTRYDKREKPASPEGILKVNVSVIVLAIETAKDSGMSTKALEYLLSLSWVDPRLIHATYEDSPPSPVSAAPSSSSSGTSGLSHQRGGPHHPSSRLHLNGIHHSSEFWAPGIRLDSGDSSIALRVYGNGSVHWMVRRKKELFCAGDAARYPFDEPVCSSTIETSTREDGLSLLWRAESPMILSRSVLLSSSVLRKMRTSDCSERMTWNGNDSCLEMKFAMGRDLNYFWSNLFVPDMVLVSSSFLTFWLDWRRCLNARIVLLVTVTLNYFIARMPAVSNSLSKLEDENQPTPAIYLWQALSVVFIYGTVIEFVFAGYMGGQRNEVPKTHGYFTHQASSHYSCRKRTYGGTLGRCANVLTVDSDNLEEGDQASINSCNLDQISQCIPMEDSFPRHPLHHHHRHLGGAPLHHENPSTGLPLPNSQPTTKFNVAQARKIDHFSRIIFPSLYAFLVSVYFLKYLYN